MNPKQIAIEVLEEAIDALQQQLEKLKAKLEKLQGDGSNSVAPQNDGGGLPPDPTHH